ncbi:MAG TPA: SAF domain-containing protein [Acidimicrobiales bacterium]|nr:SAF domain-containing protein [Acidimicrobiales bacterium]
MPLRSRARRVRRVRRSRLALTFARVRRSTLVTAVAAFTAAGLAGAVTANLLAAAAAARDRWGDMVAVDVLRRDLAPGSVIDAGDVERVERPRQLLPKGALLRAPVGRVAVAPLVAGEVVVEARVSSDLVPDGWRAIAVPSPGSGAHPDVAPGDAVDVLDVTAVDDVTTAEGIVVAVREDDGMVTVAVPAADAGRVAYAAVAGTVVLALTAAPPPR